MKENNKVQYGLYVHYMEYITLLYVHGAQIGKEQDYPTQGRRYYGNVTPVR